MKGFDNFLDEYAIKVFARVDYILFLKREGIAHIGG